MTLRVRSVALSILAVAALTLAGCAAEPATRAPEPGPSQGSPTSGGGERESELGVEGAEVAPPLVAAVQEEDCGWGSPKLFAAPELPSGTEGALDVVLVPLVAYDGTGTRAGMGAGFYDRTFALRLTTGAPPLLVGLAYRWQEVGHLARAPWDVPLDAVLTDQGLRRFPRGTR